MNLPRDDGSFGLPVDPSGPTYVVGAAEPSHPGTLVIPGYTGAVPLHQGGQGIVYRAFQESTRRMVAIKLLGGGASAAEPARRRFQREVEIAAQLSHPHIVAVFDSGITADGLPYFVMEYIEGRTLDAYIREEGLSLPEALALCLPVLDAVAFAHRTGVIHRDLKPSNVLVDGSGSPKVVDFGLARALFADLERSLSVAGQVLGTFAYMSPEQVRGRSEAIDVRTDVYSLGIILYEICTGRSPYPTDSQILDLLRHIAETPPEPPRQAWQRTSGLLDPHRPAAGSVPACPIDAALETILLRAIAKDPARRYASVEDLAHDLRAYLEGRPILARPLTGGIAGLPRSLANSATSAFARPPRGRRGRTLPGSRAALVGLLGVATLLLAGAFTLRLVGTRPASEPPPPPVPTSGDAAARIRFLAGETEYAEVREQLLSELRAREAAGSLDPVANESPAHRPGRGARTARSPRGGSWERIAPGPPPRQLPARDPSPPPDVRGGLKHAAPRGARPRPAGIVDPGPWILDRPGSGLHERGEPHERSRHLLAHGIRGGAPESRGDLLVPQAKLDAQDHHGLIVLGELGQGLLVGLQRFPSDRLLHGEEGGFHFSAAVALGACTRGADLVAHLVEDGAPQIGEERTRSRGVEAVDLAQHPDEGDVDEVDGVDETAGVPRQPPAGPALQERTVEFDEVPDRNLVPAPHLFEQPGGGAEGDESLGLGRFCHPKRVSRTPGKEPRRPPPPDATAGGPRAPDPGPQPGKGPPRAPRVLHRPRPKRRARACSSVPSSSARADPGRTTPPGPQSRAVAATRITPRSSRPIWR
jgi:hypothetical protein